MRAKYTRLFTAASGMSRFEEIDIQVHPRFTLPLARPLSVAEFECGGLHGIGRHKWHGVPRFHAASRRDERKTAECGACRVVAGLQGAGAVHRHGVHRQRNIRR